VASSLSFVATTTYYTLGITATDFGAPDPMSARTHAGTSVARFDVAHGVTVGIAKGF
jgi:hypothetical protein